MKWISLQRPNHYTGRGQSLLILTACAWNEEMPSLLFLSRSEISKSLTIPFLAWIIFLSWKIPTRITPHTRASEISTIKKDDKAVRKPKGKRAQETQMLGGMPKSQEKVITKIKWECSSKAMKKKKEKKRAKPKKSGKIKDERYQEANCW